jgi:hypothetical protein
MYDFQSERWNEFELPKLSLRELLALAKLFGRPSCGSKESVIVRVLAQRELRLKLARFTDNPEELAEASRTHRTVTGHRPAVRCIEGGRRQQDQFWP